ncbi:hypothetical protein T12_12076 [Trichinella patagoniensis]|uniref:Uncharacterized protein n=1 Tax=Trichinella patagoniensis TaxID=990121 RepID=A0A0V0Z5D4_9BILA|nr:hypothetical protein T12_12076 [Trichinella patagoniensis]
MFDVHREPFPPCMLPNKIYYLVVPLNVQICAAVSRLPVECPQCLHSNTAGFWGVLPLHFWERVSITPKRSLSPVMKSRLRIPLSPLSQELPTCLFLNVDRQLPWYVSRFLRRAVVASPSSTRPLWLPERRSAACRGFWCCGMLAMVCDVGSALFIMLLVPTATRARCCVRSERRPSPPSLIGMVRNMLFMPVCGRCRKRLTVCLMEASTSSNTLLPTPGTPNLYSREGIR